MSTPEGQEAAEVIQGALGRRSLLRAAAAVGALGTVTGAPMTAVAAAPACAPHSGRLNILQPGSGDIRGDH